jgi:hypothetical protein
MSFYLNFPNLFFDLVEIRYKRSARDAVEHCEFRENGYSESDISA